MKIGGQGLGRQARARAQGHEGWSEVSSKAQGAAREPGDRNGRSRGCVAFPGSQAGPQAPFALTAAQASRLGSRIRASQVESNRIGG